MPLFQWPPRVLPDGSGVRCRITERVYPYLNGIVDLLPGEQTRTSTQRALDTPFTAWAYDRFRETSTLPLPSNPITAVALPLPAHLPCAGMEPAEMIPGQRSHGSQRIPDNQTDHFGS